MYALFALQQQRHFNTGGYDLVIFDQAVRGYAHFGAPVSIMKGVHNGFGMHFSVLGDHFSPIIALLAPAYWIWPHVQSLLVAQALLLAASVPLVWVFTRRALGTGAAWLVTAGYAVCWPLQGAVAADVHEVAFAVPLVALALERYQAGRLRQAAVAAALLVIVKEDMGLVVAAFGALVAVRGRHHRPDRRIGGALVVGGLVAVAVSIGVLIPAFGGRADYYWSYDQLGDNAAAAAWHIVAHPASTLHIAVTPDPKWQLLLWLLVPLGLLSLASPIAVLALPLLVERLLSSNPNYWTTDHHYSAILAPIFVLAAVDGAARLTARLRHERGRRVAGRLRVGWAAGVLTVAVVIGFTRFPFYALLTGAEWTTSAREQTAATALAHVPPGVLVEASNDLAPHLADRDRVLLLDRYPRGAPWVIVDMYRVSFPFTTPAPQRARVAELKASGYHVVFHHDGYVVLHRPVAP